MPSDSAASEREHAAFRVVGAAQDWYVAHGDVVADRAWGTKRRNDKARVYRQAEQRLIDAVHDYRRDYAR